MKKKVVIITAAIMAVVAISLGLGLGLGLERNINFGLKEDGFSDIMHMEFRYEIQRADTVEEFEELHVRVKSYGEGYFQKRSIIFVTIEDGINDYYREITKVVKKGKTLKIYFANTYDFLGIPEGMIRQYFIELKKTDLLGVTQIEAVFD